METHIKTAFAILGIFVAATAISLDVVDDYQYAFVVGQHHRSGNLTLTCILVLFPFLK